MFNIYYWRFVNLKLFKQESKSKFTPKCLLLLTYTYFRVCLVCNNTCIGVEICDYRTEFICNEIYFDLRLGDFKKLQKMWFIIACSRFLHF